MQAGTNTEFSYGVIEGFFGRTWSWETRRAYAEFLKQQGYQFYLYAPKADTYLRRQWQQPWPSDTFAELATLGGTYQDTGLQWGIGLTPFEIHFDYDADTIAQLETKVKELNRLQPNILAILFDDMRGDFYQIAQIQVEVTHRIMELSTAQSFIMCPTYYADTPLLDKIFGQRPPDYLETLGASLDPSVQVFWTGPEVCSTAYPTEHLQDITHRLGRKPFIWDNYPVNDSARMSPFLHLRAFSGRPYQMADWTAGHAVNPMNQAYLSQIPLMTLAMNYQQQAAYDPATAFTLAAQSLCGEEFAALLQDDLPLVQDQGLNGMSDAEKAAMISRYQDFDTPYSQELLAWVRGEYPFDPACLTA
jgi:hyaluronoglucosaminidase